MLLRFFKKMRALSALRPSIPFDGFQKNRIHSGFIEELSDNDLVYLNTMLPWKCFTVDSNGRRFGNSAWKGKRDEPQVVPDPRIIEMSRLFDLANQSVLEVGCFEGIHTMALAQFAKKVYAIDSRIENVVKTIVRMNMVGLPAQVTVCDLEKPTDAARLPTVDLIHHVGVLYHLQNPVAHLMKLADIARNGLLLDTHYATSEMINADYATNGKKYCYYVYRENGRDEVFSGMYDHAKWLLLEDIQDILKQIGFTDIRVIKNTHQRNGPRVSLFAARPSIMRSN